MPVTRSISASALLVYHAESPGQFIRGIEAKVESCQSRALAFSYTLKADMDQLLIPVAAAACRVDGLWRHTCFEAFIGLKDGPAYVEFNFSPSGEWAVYGFGKYRDGAPLGGEEIAPTISVRSAVGRLELAATVRLERTFLVQPGTILRIGLSAVIEATDGSLSYWALNHPSDKPDFHHPDSFALELALPTESA